MPGTDEERRNSALPLLSVVAVDPFKLPRLLERVTVLSGIGLSDWLMTKTLMTVSEIPSALREGNGQARIFERSAEGVKSSFARVNRVSGLLKIVTAAKKAKEIKKSVIRARSFLSIPLFNRSLA